MFCPVCGTRVPENTGQCPNCKSWFRVEVEARPAASDLGHHIEDLRALTFLFPEEEVASPVPARDMAPSGRAVKLWKWGLVGLVGLYLLTIMVLTVMAVRQGLAERRRLQGEIAYSQEMVLPLG